MTNIKRMWVNQPSTQQQYHSQHGTKVLAEITNDEIIDVYFLSGAIIGQKMHKIALSQGWNETTGEIK